MTNGVGPVVWLQANLGGTTQEHDGTHEQMHLQLGPMLVG